MCLSLQQINFNQAPFLLNLGTDLCQLNICRFFIQLLLPSSVNRRLRKAAAVPNAAVKAKIPQLIAWRANRILYVPSLYSLRLCQRHHFHLLALNGGAFSCLALSLWGTGKTETSVSSLVLLTRLPPAVEYSGQSLFLNWCRTEGLNSKWKHYTVTKKHIRWRYHE